MSDTPDREPLQGLDMDKLAEMKAEADAEAAKTADDQGAPDTAESPTHRRLGEEAERAAALAKWDTRLKAKAAEQRDNPPAPPEADALQGDDGPEALPEPPPASGTNDPPDYRVDDRHARQRAEAEADLSGKRKRTGKRTGKRKREPEAPKVDTGAVLAQLGAVPMDDAALALLARIEGGPDARVPTIDDLLAFKYWDDELAAEVRGAVAAALRDLALALGDDGRPWAEPHLLTYTADGEKPALQATIGRDPTEELLRLMTPGGQQPPRGRS